MSLKNIKSELLSKFQEVKKGRNPRITPGIDAVVVLSGESGDPKNPTILNDTQDRTKFGIKILKSIQKRGDSPLLILNGTKAQNNLMAKMARKRRITKIMLFKNPPPPQASTLSQFQAMEKLTFKKIAIVTHAYHGIRTEKYAEKYLPKKTQFQLFLFERSKMSRNQIEDEIEKILKYRQKGDT